MLDISVIIPFKDKADMTIDCLRSLKKYGDPVKEILLISNNSSQQELKKVVDYTAEFKEIKVLEYNKPFNYQTVNNWGISQSKGKVILMLNNDVELVPRSEGLIKHMYEQSLLKDTGEVGCVLLFGDNKNIQHGGVYLVAGGTADHMYLHEELAKVEHDVRGSKQRFDITKTNQVTAVTGAVTMLERKKFNKINGMNEKFILCGGDVDLGIRLTKAGLKNLLVGSDHGIMLHKESVSRKHVSIPYSDFQESYRSYTQIFNTQTGDPFVGKYL